MITYEQIEKIMTDVTSLGAKIRQLKDDMSLIIGELEHIEKINDTITKENEMISHEVVYIRKLDEILQKYVMKDAKHPEGHPPDSNLQIYNL